MRCENLRLNEYIALMIMMTLVCRLIYVGRMWRLVPSQSAISVLTNV